MTLLRYDLAVIGAGLMGYVRCSGGTDAWNECCNS